MRTIVVGYDDTEPARQALRRAAELAQASGARLIVTTAVSPEEVDLSGLAAGGAPELTVDELERARAFLGELGVEAEYQVSMGEPADGIVEVAERQGADLIVVGTRDPGPIERMLGHSVSHAVLRRARCYVLIVRR